MAYKVFSNGSVLNASDLNDYLMKQAVMVFSSSTARSSALTSPTEGMLTWLEDTNVYQYYDGSAWTNLISAGTPVGTGNIIINGAFEINQRNYVSGANLASGAYGFDRWKSNFTNTTLTFTSAPQGQELVINSGGGIEQVVERQNILPGTYTLSWSGTATGRIYNTGATPPSYAASPITVTLDGSANVEVEFTASGGSKTIKDVQLEAGSTATSFRRAGSSAEEELAACQRYYFRWTSSGNEYGYYGSPYASTNGLMSIPLPVSLRANPTSVDFSNIRLFDLVNPAHTVSNIVLSNPSRHAPTVDMVTSGLVVYRPYTVLTNGAGFLGFSAEL